MSARPLNYTTKIDVRQTVGELTEMLGEHGAVAIGVEYADRKPVGLTFVLDTAIGSRGFRLPVDPAGMYRALLAARQRGDFRSLKIGEAKLDQLTSPEQAERVAWRVVRDWLEAQLALVAAELARVDQVMLPYMVVDGGQSLYAAVVDRQLAIGRGGDPL